MESLHNPAGSWLCWRWRYAVMGEHNYAWSTLLVADRHCVGEASSRAQCQRKLYSSTPCALPGSCGGCSDSPPSPGGCLLTDTAGHLCEHRISSWLTGWSWDVVALSPCKSASPGCSNCLPSRSLRVSSCLQSLSPTIPAPLSL